MTFTVRIHQRPLTFLTLILVCYSAVTGQEKTEKKAVPVTLSELVHLSLQKLSLDQEKRRFYTYKIQTNRRVFKKAEVRETSELYEMYLPAHQRSAEYAPMRILLEKNGQPVPAERLQKIKRTIEQRKGTHIEEDIGIYWGDSKLLLETQSYIGIRALRDDGGYIWFGASEELEKCDFVRLPRETLSGREMIVLKFTAKPRAKFDRDMEYLKGCEGRIWIDAQDLGIARLLVWPIGTKFENEESSTLLKNAPLVFDQVRTSAGHWLPRFERINGAELRDFLKMATREEVTSEFTEYFYFRPTPEKGQNSPPVKRN